ncbi:hypothetical protein [Telluribacter sp. SYSU D00476]|uniref:hypothetical protein n=1 Tax=Telluribacter sp. SYSU D00476 TaxID=2811430 RepID=UPI001FF58C48|nr:hypothetical protein [Telluribacter sp. SYSU D00476]
MKQPLQLASILLIFNLLLVVPSLGQQASPKAKAYTYLIYHKLAPGYTLQDALPIEREWKALNQAAVDEGNLIGWYMMAKQLTSNPDAAEYDYVTMIISSEMTIKGASPAARTKIYGDSVQARMADLQKRDRTIAPVVKMEIWETADAIISPGFAPDKTPILVLDLIRLRDPAADWRSLTGPMKRMASERVKNSQLAGWNISTLMVPHGSEKGYSLAVVRCAASLSAAVQSDGATGAVPAAEVAKLKTQQIRTFDIVRQEVYRLTEFTLNPRSTADASR